MIEFLLKHFCNLSFKEENNNMNIIEALKTSDTLRVSSGKKWLIWNSTIGKWEVYKNHRGKGILIEQTDFESVAVKSLND